MSDKPKSPELIISKALTAPDSYVVYSIPMAVAIGETAAAVLHQLYTFARSNAIQGDSKWRAHGLWWCRINVERLHKLRFPHLSIRTVKSALAELERLGFIFVGKLNNSAKDTTNSYAINVWAITAFLVLHEANNVPAANLRGNEANQRDEFITKWVEEVGPLTSLEKFLEVQLFHSRSENFAQREVQLFHFVSIYIYYLIEYPFLSDVSSENEEDDSQEVKPKGKRNSSKAKAVYLPEQYTDEQNALITEMARWRYESEYRNATSAWTTHTIEEAARVTPKFDGLSDEEREQALHRGWLSYAAIKNLEQEDLDAEFYEWLGRGFVLVKALHIPTNHDKLRNLVESHLLIWRQFREYIRKRNKNQHQSNINLATVDYTSSDPLGGL